MEEKEIKIKVPDGYEIDKENSTFECIRFKPIKKELPKTWKEFCKIYPRKKGESWIDIDSIIKSIIGTAGNTRDDVGDRNILPDKKYAEAMLALCQLIQLRDCYNDGWVPNWINNDVKYIIYIVGDKPTKETYGTVNRILAFKSANIRNQFYVNFRDLIEIAKPLL